MDVVIFAALPSVTDKELRASIGRTAQIRRDGPWRSAEKGQLAANILFPQDRRNRAPLALPTNAGSHLPAQAKLS